LLGAIDACARPRDHTRVATMAKLAFDSRVLHEEDGFLYSIATGERREQIVGILSESFCREPMGLALGVSAADLAPLIERLHRFTRRGIANRLFGICSDVVRDSGFKRCVTECTGHYSQAAAQRAGFKEVARLAYKDFRLEGKPVFARIGSPHTHLVLYEREL
jgi:hypothetical protein